jgi:hypothetical protein
MVVFINSCTSALTNDVPGDKNSAAAKITKGEAS